MKTALRIIVGLIVGAISGAIVGAVMLGVPNYFDDSCDFLGCARDWTPVVVYMGVICGSIPGAVIGLLVGITSVEWLNSVGIGALTGVVIAIVLFFMGARTDELVGVLAVLSIPGGALVGLVVKQTLRLVRLTDPRMKVSEYRSSSTE